MKYTVKENYYPDKTYYLGTFDQFGEFYPLREYMVEDEAQAAADELNSPILSDRINALESELDNLKMSLKGLTLFVLIIFTIGCSLGIIYIYNQ